MGVFYVGGVQVESPYSDGRNAEFPTSGRTTVSGQAKITFLIPTKVSGANIILMPGFGLSSSIYLTTPDGREGWAQYFARQGHPVYVMDLPGRGTATFPVDAINGCAASDTAFPCPKGAMLGRTSLEQPWSVWGFGPRFGERFADSRFPAEPLEQNYIEQFGAAFEVFVGPAAMGAGRGRDVSVNSLQKLLERIGPSVVVLHSAAGATGFALAERNPALFTAIVAIETTSCPKNREDGSSPLANIPFLSFYGDYVTERTAGGHPRRYASCKMTAETLAGQGTTAAFVDLPADKKIRGNSHLMMLDDNSDELAGMIAAWLSSTE
jgi:pimeloyl-ACP methyl ester carboxylesterase